MHFVKQSSGECVGTLKFDSLQLLTESIFNEVCFAGMLK